MRMTTTGDETNIMKDPGVKSNPEYILYYNPKSL